MIAPTPAHLLLSCLHMVAKLEPLLQWQLLFKIRHYGLFDSVFNSDSDQQNILTSVQKFEFCVVFHLQTGHL